MNLEERIKSKIRDIPNFPKEGILFKDITPLLKDIALSQEITAYLADQWRNKDIDAIVGIESRGFIWGNAMAQAMKIPFVPIRKKGKLPAETYAVKYDLEYGTAEIEIHTDGLEKGWNVLIHDDLLATGGTARAASELVTLSGANVAGFSFLVELTFLTGSSELRNQNTLIQSLISY